jgi:endo-1,4-beta-xylanase
MKTFLIAFSFLLFSNTGSKKVNISSTDDLLLKDVYKNAFLMGVAVSPAITSGRDKASQDIVIRHFNSITVENG